MYQSPSNTETHKMMRGLWYRVMRDKRQIGYITAQKRIWSNGEMVGYDMSALDDESDILALFPDASHLIPCYGYSRMIDECCFNWLWEGRKAPKRTRTTSDGKITGKENEVFERLRRKWCCPDCVRLWMPIVEERTAPLIGTKYHTVTCTVISDILSETVFCPKHQHQSK